MGKFNKEKRFGGGRDGKKFDGKRDFGGRSFGGDRGRDGGFGGRRDRERSEMHKAICSNCGKECEVPFRPTGDKPVFCSDCFKNKGDNDSRDFRGKGDRGKGDFGRRNDRPRFDDKRSYQKDSGGGAESYNVQFEQLNAKLDKILRMLNQVAPEEKKEIKAPKFKKFERAPKKEIETVALKKVITKATSKKPTAKKLVTKKPTSKKVTVKKTVPKKGVNRDKVN
jgi:CxxC-x17-CxxC domain-containing protein